MKSISHAPRSPRIARAPTMQDRQRHKDMLSVVFAWMNRTGGTQQLLVRCIQEFWQRRGEPDYRCDHTLLSRILNPAQPHIPTPRRPQSMRILQAAMIVCTAAQDPNVVAPATDDDALWSSDEDHAFKVHRARLRNLREHGRSSLFESFHRLGEFCAVARWMDDAAASNELGETLRQRAIENVLLAIAALVDPGADAATGGDLVSRLIFEGISQAEAQRLVSEQFARVDALLSAAGQCGVNMHGYGGAALFHCGQRERGITMLLDAVAQSCDLARRHDPHWETLLELLDRLLVGGDAAAVEWSCRAAKVAQAQQSPQGLPGAAKLLARAWQMVNAPRVREHWLAIAPGVIERIEAAPAPAVDVPAVVPVTRIKLSNPLAVGMAMLLAGLLATLGLARPTSPVAPHGDRSVIEQAAPAIGLPMDQGHGLSGLLAIRGREALRPEPPPNSPSGSDRPAVS